jgi:tetratricopeptide (TPR) repeat protein
MSDIWSNAVSAHQEGNFRLAKQLYDQVLEDAKQAQDFEAFSIVLYHLARLALDYDQEGPEVALHRFKKLLKSQERLGDNAGISRTLREIATIYEQQDELVSAIRYGEKALTSAKDVYDQQQMAASYHLLGLLYQYAKLPSQAVTAMKEAQNHWEQLGNVLAWQNTTMVFADILEEQESFAPCVRELRRLLKTLDDQEDIEDIAEIHFRVAGLFVRQGDYQNALIHMLACLLRNQAMDSDFVQRDAMVLMKIRDRIGHVEFEFLVEKKLGLENKNNLMHWLAELFPPEESDPAIQRIPEPQALSQPEQTYEEPLYIPEPVPVQSSSVELPPPPKQKKSGDRPLPQPVSETPQISEPNGVLVEPLGVPVTPEFLEPLSESPTELSNRGSQPPSQSAPAAVEPVAPEFLFDEKTEERPPVEAPKQPESLVNWDEESGEFSQHTENPLQTENSLPNEWTQYTEPVQSMPEIPLPALTQHFVAALLGAMGVLAIVQWVL